MFGVLLLTACTLLLAYVLWRVSSLPWFGGKRRRRILFAAGGGLWALFLVSQLLGHDSSGAAAAVFELLAMDGLATMFLVAVALLVVDLATGFGRFFRAHVVRLRLGALGAGVLLAGLAMVQGMRAPAVASYDVRLPGLPAAADGTVVVALSDLHLGTLLGSDWLAARVAQVEEQKPDLVVLLGDLFEGHGAPDEALRGVLRRLAAPLGVWAVTGNHESHGGDDSAVRLLERSGIRVLHDEWVEVRPGLVLAGVDDLTARRRRGEGGDPIGRALAPRPPGGAILLSHSPVELERAARAGAGLTLSGHTHGGQIWPFGLLSGAFYPVVAGLDEVDGMTVLVGRGTGTWGPRMRLWSRGEILRVTLRAPGTIGAR
jgi:predicted MPP superfamily phosphohydrolase